MIFEGVPYTRYRVFFRTTDGKCHQRTFWGASLTHVRFEIGQALHEEYGESERTAIEASSRLAHVGEPRK